MNALNFPYALWEKIKGEGSFSCVFSRVLSTSICLSVWASLLLLPTWWNDNERRQFSWWEIMIGVGGVTEHWQSRGFWFSLWFFSYCFMPLLLSIFSNILPPVVFRKHNCNLVIYLFKKNWEYYVGWRTKDNPLAKQVWSQFVSLVSSSCHTFLLFTTLWSPPWPFCPSLGGMKTASFLQGWAPLVSPL